MTQSVLRLSQSFKQLKFLPALTELLGQVWDMQSALLAFASPLGLLDPRSPQNCFLYDN